MLALAAILLAAAIALAGGAWLLRAPRRHTTPVTAATGVAMWATLALAPTGEPLVRLAMFAVVGGLLAKVVDVWRHRFVNGDTITWRRFLVLMVDPLALTLARAGRRLPADTPAGPDLRRLAVAVPVAVGAWALLVRLLTAPPFPDSFWLDHTTKVLTLAVVIESTGQVVHGIARLLGHDSVLVVEFATLARSPADFWRRYNRIIGDWLNRNVFRPLGGHRHAVRATLATFAVSGLVHEAIFAFATERVTGYQLAFFLLQGVGVLLSAPIERHRRHPVVRVVGTVLTLAFLIATTSLFLASLDLLVGGGWYAAPVPLWR